MKQPLLHRATVTTVALGLLLAAAPAGAGGPTYLLQGEQGPQGEQGDAVLDCTMGDCVLTGYSNLIVSGEISAATATVTGAATFGDLQTDTLTVQVRHDFMAECPEGYERDWSEVGIVVCYRPGGSGDEMVGVGDFWIDRYEISVWTDPGCLTGQLGAAGDDYDAAGFPDTGNWTTPAYACSVPAVPPARALTWYQAQQACALAGKQLCSNAQWQAAAAGTPDDTTCNAYQTGLADTGASAGCHSAWGVFDMVGNQAEWVALLAGHPGFNGSINEMSMAWGEDGYWAGGPDYNSNPTYGSDGSWRPYSPGFDGAGDSPGDDYGPAAALRGGYRGAGTAAGVFALQLDSGPSASDDEFGARCCRME